MSILQIKPPNWVSKGETEHGWQYSPSLKDIPGEDPCLCFQGQAGELLGLWELVDLDPSCSEAIYCALMELLVKPKALVEIQ